MTERKVSTGTKARSERKREGESGGRGRRRPEPDGDSLDVTWDQPQPGYPAPERPLDRAEESERNG